MKKIKTYLIHLLGGVTKREAFCAHVKKTIELVTDVTGKTLPLGSLVAVKHLKKYCHCRHCTWENMPTAPETQFPCSPLSHACTRDYCRHQ